MASKKKLVYADDLFSEMCDDISINGANLARIKRHIEKAPAVDAEEVVRYKNCKRYDTSRTNERGNHVCSFHTTGVQEHDVLWVKAEDFCSAGERK